MKKKIAILGCENSHANNFLDYINANIEYKESLEIVGVYSNDPEAAKALSEKYGVKVLESYSDAVGLVDGVIITARHGKYPQRDPRHAACPHPTACRWRSW